MTDKYKHIETKLVHAGEPEPRVDGAVAMPIFQTAMFETYGDDNYHDVRYIRLNNTPNHAVLHAKLAAIENAEAALVTASGMAAITTGMLSVLKSGDHMLIQNSLYGGTHNFVTNDMPDLGFETDFIDPNDPGSWESKLKPNTKAIYVEAISNPMMLVGDLKAAVDFAKAHNLVSMIDNTFASPVNFRPAEHGFDLAYHSATKYLNGHNDLVAGCVMGRGDLVTKVKHKIDHLGGTLDPHACYLLHRGLKTLALRVRQQNNNAQAIAEFLEGHSKVASVNYPGLPNHPAHARAKSLFDGFGGMLSFEVAGGTAAVDKLLRAATIPIIAPSLGGADSLMTVPARTSHVGMSPEDRQTAGITDTLIRMSVGIEAADDIIADLDQALS